MTFTNRLDKALALLAETGMARSNYAPPVFRLLWWLGVELPPPHFIRFRTAVVSYGLWFACFWGTLMWLTVWSAQGMSAAAALATAVGTGLLFGLAMAGFSAQGRRKHHLPRWRDLDDKPLDPVQHF